MKTGFSLLKRYFYFLILFIMKNRFLFIAVLIFTGTLFGNVSAQESKISVGAGLNYATDIENIGLSLQGLYKINPTWEVSPKFTYFFKKNYMTYSALDFNGHYVFSDNGSNAFYALAGLNITFYKFKYDRSLNTGSNQFSYDEEYGDYLGDLYDDAFNFDYSGNDTGLNLGVGGRFSLTDALDLNAEAKYTTSYSGYLNIGVGLLYKF
jgi:hypothetical protein